MTTNTQARSGYGANNAAARTPRGTEYAVFAQVTHRLSSVDEADKTKFPQVAAAVHDNFRLWGTLAEDLMNDENTLPVPLRAQLISLSQFVQKHGMKVLGGDATLAPLVDINTSIMRGLRENAEAGA